MVGDNELARERFESALSATDAPAIEACTLAHLALLDLRVGRLRDASHDADRALAVANRHHLEAIVPAIPVFAIGALVAARTGRPDESRALAIVASDMIDRLGRVSPRTGLLCNLVLAQAAMACGDRGTARRSGRGG